jgi:hypothetical protein
MTQPKGFVVEGKEHLFCLMKKSIYGFKENFKTVVSQVRQDY